MASGSAHIRWFQFRLRAILGLIMACAIILAAAARWREHAMNRAVYRALEVDWPEYRVEFSDTPLDSALEFVADDAAVRIELHDSVDEATAISLKAGGNNRAVLEAILDSVDATYEIRSGVIYVEPRLNGRDYR